jgi:hypothetical protein
VSFLSAVGAILDGGGIRRSLRCCAGHPFSRRVSLQVMLVSFRWEGDLTIYICTCCGHVTGWWWWWCEGGVREECVGWAVCERGAVMGYIQ